MAFKIPENIEQIREFEYYIKIWKYHGQIPVNIREFIFSEPLKQQINKM